MKIMKKRISLIICFVMVLTLCACGGKNNDTKKQDTPAVVGTSDSPVRDSETQGGTYTLSEYLKTGETIWYNLAENKGKDSKVTDIFVLEPDGSMYFVKRPGYTLGELEQMEDADIAAMVKKSFIEQCAIMGYEEFLDEDEQTEILALQRKFFSILFNGMDYGNYSLNMEDYTGAFMGSVSGDTCAKIAEREWETIETMYNEWVTMCDSLENKNIIYGLYGRVGSFVFDDAVFEEVISEHRNSDSDVELIKSTIAAIRATAGTLGETAYREIMEIIEGKRTNPDLTQYKLVIITDSTGNNTEYMKLAYTNPMQYGTPVCQYKLYWYPIPTGAGSANTIVYDSAYNGFDSSDGVFYTRVSENVQLVLDQVGESELPIDVKNVATLFE